MPIAAASRCLSFIAATLGTQLGRAQATAKTARTYSAAGPG